jgi:Zn finger protein HypA/HybF involved in hydrogenase expression
VNQNSSYRQETSSVKVEVKFINDEITCPTCESYSVNELVAGCKCERCGQTWVTAISRK